MESKDGLQHEIVADLKRVAFDLGHSPGREEYREKGKFSDRQVRNAYGAFTVALRAAGMEPKQDRMRVDPAVKRHEVAVQRHVDKVEVSKHFESQILPWVGKYDRGITGVLQIMVRGDDHSQWVDPWCDEVFWAEAKRSQPDVIVFNGDVFDFYQVSSHDKNPRRLMTMQSELDFVVTKLLKRARETCPNAQIDLVLGNHERRLFYYLCNEAPALSSLRCLRFDDLFCLKEYEINLVARPSFLSATSKDADNFKRYGPLTITHGTRAGAQPASKEFEVYGTSGISNHVHRNTIWRKRNLHGDHIWLTNGAMCQLKSGEEYIADLINWNQGFTRAHVDGQYVLMEYADLSNPVACVGGVYYRKKGL